MTRVQPTGDGSLTLYSEHYAQTFASERGALSESQGVFLEGSGVAARLAAGETLRVLEVGFGTGLNFFVTAAACSANPAARLAYTALEHTLLDAPTVRSLGYETLLANDVVTAYLAWRDALGTPSGSCVFATERVTLTCLLGEATAQILPKAAFHSVYHDAFSPTVNPELWTESFLAELSAALEPGGTLVSYCVQGAVQRQLATLGLTVTKRPGPPGGKREVLLAQKPDQPDVTS